MSLTNYYTYNTEKAKELLTEAGYPNGFDMTITVPSNYQPHMDTAQVIVEQLKAVGINATIQPVHLGELGAGRLLQPAVPVHCGGRGRFQHDRPGHAGAVRLHRQPTTSSTTTTRTMTPCSPRPRPATTMGSRPPFTEQMEKNLAENAANVYIQDMADLVAVRDGLEGPSVLPHLRAGSFHYPLYEISDEQRTF